MISTITVVTCDICGRKPSTGDTSVVPPLWRVIPKRGTDLGGSRCDAHICTECLSLITKVDDKLKEQPKELMLDNMRTAARKVARLGMIKELTALISAYSETDRISDIPECDRRDVYNVLNSLIPKTISDDGK